MPFVPLPKTRIRQDFEFHLFKFQKGQSGMIDVSTKIPLSIQSGLFDNELDNAIVSRDDKNLINENRGHSNEIMIASPLGTSF